MSKINDLIKELCPNGVEYLELYKVVKWNKRFSGVDKKCQPEILNTNSDVSAQLLKTLVVDNGNIKLLSTGNFDGYTDDVTYTGIIDENEVITIPSGGTANIKYYNGRFINSGNILGSSLDDKKYNLKYVYYCLTNKNELIQSFFRGSSVQHPDMKQIIQIRIPIPPLEVQEEIVKILDKFGELEAELEARKSQYEFWRGKIWNDVEIYDSVCLSELCKIGDGLHGTPDYDENGNYYFINGNNLNNSTIEYDEKTKRVSDTCYEKLKKSFSENVILMSINGTIGKVSIYNNESVVLGKSVAYFDIIDNSKLLKKYLFYYLQSEKSQMYYDESKTGSTIKNLGLKALREYSIPLSTLEDQERIVSILDKFDKLVNDISEGLPAEIEARRKQYEYYRNKLLDFKEIESN